ncbi:hypothetical protein [Escherichia albertii]|uniref:hypothetical protein n=3 Tax=Escherichia albertii TaxID=208962 RepID=UPI000CF70AE1|nr:hypothetical protein [Escherichia albertii]
MTHNNLKINNIYFFLYIATLLLPLVTYFFAMNDITTIAVFYVAAIACVIFDQKEIAKAVNEYAPRFATSVIGVILFPPLYVYSRSKAVGAKLNRRLAWLFAYIVIMLGCCFITAVLDDNEALESTACEVTTSILKDKGSNVTCLVVEDVKEITDKHYRAKAVLSNGMGMPIVIEERDDGYIYVTLAPLSDLFDLFD